MAHQLGILQTEERQFRHTLVPVLIQQDARVSAIGDDNPGPSGWILQGLSPLLQVASLGPGDKQRLDRDQWRQEAAR
jgi:hypothetical protein